MFSSLVHGSAGFDAAAVVRNTHHREVWVLLACAVSFAGAYLQYVGAITMGFRDRTYSIPLVANLWFFAHDTTYVVQFHRWFHDESFWLVKAFWFALLVFAAGETVVTFQILRFSRRTLFPGLSLVQAIGCYAGLQAFAYGVFWWFQSMTDDPFYYLSFATTVILAPLLNIPMMRSRRSRRGFSMPMLTGFLLLAVGFWAWMFLSDDYFLRPYFGLIAIGNVGLCVVAMIEFRRLPAFVPADTVPTPHVPGLAVDAPRQPV